MPIKHTNQGWIASSLLLAAITASFGFAGGVRSQPRQDPTQGVGTNPVQQRIDMITHLQSIDQRMASVEKSLKNLERAASAELQLMMKAQQMSGDAASKPVPKPEAVEQKAARKSEAGSPR